MRDSLLSIIVLNKALFRWNSNIATNKVNHLFVVYTPVTLIYRVIC